MRPGLIQLIRKETTDPAGFGIAYQSTNDLNDGNSVWDLLHREEKRHYDQLKYDRQKQAYLLGRAAAKRAIRALAPQIVSSDILIDSGVFGFPVVRYRSLENVQVSISHTDQVGLALAYPESHPLGVDTERVDRDRIASVEGELDHREHLLLGDLTLPHPVGLTLLWTIKESLSKVLRTGLTLDMKLAAVKSLVRVDNVWIGHFRNFGQYKSLSVVTSTQVCSIVLPDKTSTDLTPLIDSWKSYLKQ